MLHRNMVLAFRQIKASAEKFSARSSNAPSREYFDEHDGGAAIALPDTRWGRSRRSFSASDITGSAARRRDVASSVSCSSSRYTAYSDRVPCISDGVRRHDSEQHERLRLWQPHHL